MTSAQEELSSLPRHRAEIDPALAAVTSSFLSDIEAQPQTSRTEPQEANDSANFRRRHTAASPQSNGDSKKSNDPLAFLQIFQELGDRSHGRDNCVFICWGSATAKQWAVDIPIRDVDDQVGIFQDIRKRWSETRSLSWKMTRFLRRVSVKEVEITFIAYEREQGRFVVNVELADERLNEYRRCYTERAEKAQADMDRIAPRKGWVVSDICSWDSRTGAYRHSNTECPEFDGFVECPFRRRDAALKNLNSLRLYPRLLIYCFEQPEYARGQNPLEGRAQSSCIYKYSLIGSSLTRQPEPRLGDVQLNGLFIDDEWAIFPSQHSAVSVLAAALLVAMLVALGKLNSNGLVVALTTITTLLTMANVHYAAITAKATSGQSGGVKN